MRYDESNYCVARMHLSNCWLCLRSFVEFYLSCLKFCLSDFLEMCALYEGVCLAVSNAISDIDLYSSDHSVYMSYIT